MWHALAMPQASERWLATPIIRPRLPRMRPEISDILRPRTRISAPGFLWHRVVGRSSARRLRNQSRLLTRRYADRKLLRFAISASVLRVRHRSFQVGGGEP